MIINNATNPPASGPSNSPARSGLRGYIASRPVRGTETPQAVQNLVIRDYARRRGLAFKLSATEYAMPGCYMMLDSVVDELPQLEGMICFSMFMLPASAERRHAVYRRVLASGATLHAALEDMAIAGPADIARFEDVLLVDRFVSRGLAAAE